MACRKAMAPPGGPSPVAALEPSARSSQNMTPVAVAGRNSRLSEPLGAEQQGEDRDRKPRQQPEGSSCPTARRRPGLRGVGSQRRLLLGRVLADIDPVG